jgi:hypothetical protein
LILIDTNVLLDLVTDDPTWAEWSQRQLGLAAALDELAINDVVYAELSVRYARIEELDAMIGRAGLVHLRYHARRCFSRQRPSSDIERRAESGPASYRISSSALMLSSRGAA